jgi:hypothetical protein
MDSNLFWAVNYHKSGIVPINPKGSEEVHVFIDIFGCRVGEFPIKYLDIPLHYHKLKGEDPNL